MKEYIKLIRLKHWLKNFLIFLPIFFSGRIFNINYIKPTLLAFFIFSFTASVVYIINDIEEVKKEIDSFYTDSFSDKPMMGIARRSFLVKNLV